MVKDLTLAQDAANAAGAVTPLCKHAQEIYQGVRRRRPRRGGFFRDYPARSGARRKITGRRRMGGEIRSRLKKARPSGFASGSHQAARRTD